MSQLTCDDYLPLKMWKTTTGYTQPNILKDGITNMEFIKLYIVVMTSDSWINISGSSGVKCRGIWNHLVLNQCNIYQFSSS